MSTSSSGMITNGVIDNPNYIKMIHVLWKKTKHISPDGRMTNIVDPGKQTGNRERHFHLSPGMTKLAHTF